MLTVLHPFTSGLIPTVFLAGNALGESNILTGQTTSGERRIRTRISS
jgi:hypothetical protein